MFPDKARMVRSANALLAILSIAAVVYIILAEAAVFGRQGLARNQGIAPIITSALAIVSIGIVAITVFTQTRWRPMAGKANYDPITRVYLIVTTGAILSETHSIFGMVLTLLYGSIFSAIGFSLASWASLLWVRSRFKKNLARIPS